MDAPRPFFRALPRILTAAVLPLVPALLAIALVPEFVTQDGTSHLYNARIIRLSLAPDSPFREAFEVRWQPLPNWAGHLLFIALDAAFRPDVADRLATAITLVLLATSIVALRYVVAGGSAVLPTGCAAAILALNVTWLFGFTGFLMGAALTPLTWAVWWSGRSRIGFVWSIRLTALLVLGYFCHPISLGLTVFGLMVLTALECGRLLPRDGEESPQLASFGRAEQTPREPSGRKPPHSGRLLAWTALALFPLLPLGLMYLGLTREGGKMEPVWEHLADPLSPASWANQLGWVDPISLAGKGFRPFSSSRTPLNLIFAPVFWTGIGFVSSIRGTLRDGDRNRPWGLLGGLILAAGILGPDTLGVSHGHYMPQRVVLIGFVSLIPCLRFGRLSTICLGVALALQSAFVWDYALDCRARGGEFLDATGALKALPGQTIGTLLTGTAGKFRSNPLLHLDTRIGLNTDAVVLSDYETSHYYFPVRFRESLDHPPARLFEDIARLDDPSDAPKRAELWSDLLGRYHLAIDWLVVVGGDPALDAATGRWFEPVSETGRVRVFRRKP